ncbi:MAG: glutamate decarboxylase [Oceanospirillaceae bacterium]|nr:glutamate decarboxylase [Oceanospirillaceae bacterium]
MQQYLNIFQQLATQYFRQDRAVSEPISAKDLKKIIDFSLGFEGADVEALKQAASQYLTYQPDSAQVDFFKLLYSGRNDPALLGDWVTSLSNANMHTYQMSPVATLMEQELIHQWNRLIGFTNDSKTGDGIMVSGGSQANLIGMMMARHRACPELKTAGMSAQKLVAFVSDQAHYSGQKAANLLGIGTDNLIAVASDSEGRLCPDALLEAVEHSIAQGHKPFYIGLTAGTTVVGAFDPVPKCRAIADKYNIWLHIDGAWGAPVLFSKTHRHLLKGCELADSFAWDAHKLMNVPLTAAVVLTRHQGMLEQTCGGGGGDYLFHSDENAAYNLGQKSIQCGRRADALKVWLSWKAMGNKGFSDKIDRLQDIKQGCVNTINASSQLHMIGPSPYLNVLFQYRPEVSLNEVELRALNISICKTMQAQGGAFVDYAKYQGQTGIRLILANSDTQTNDIERLLEHCIKTGDSLAKAS